MLYEMGYEGIGQDKLLLFGKFLPSHMVHRQTDKTPHFRRPKCKITNVQVRLSLNCWTTNEHTRRILTIKPTRCAKFLKFIFGIKLYMFQTVPLSIIRSFPLYTQQWYMSYRFAVSIPVWHIPLLCVQWKTPDEGQRNCPKHTGLQSKNKFQKLVHLVGSVTVTWIVTELTKIERTDEDRRLWPQIIHGQFLFSPELFDDLANKKIYCCGTVRPSRREMPQDLVQKTTKLRRGDICIQNQGWLDSNTIAGQEKRHMYVDKYSQCPSGR